jgi:hypothetical protein
VTATETPRHVIRWYLWQPAPGRAAVKVRHTGPARNVTGGWDAECSCGWQSATGGATRHHIQREVWRHKAGVSA